MVNQSFDQRHSPNGSMPHERIADFYPAVPAQPALQFSERAWDARQPRQVIVSEDELVS